MAAQRAKILSIDGGRPNRTLLRRLLRRANAVVVEVASAEQARDILSRDEFALVLLDVNTPSVDGYEAAELVRASPLNRSTPIIFLGDEPADSALTSRVCSAGGVDYLCRPLDDVALLAKVETFVNLHQAKEDLRQRGLRNATVLECAAEGIMALTESGRIAYVNSAAVSMLGWSAQDLEGCTLQKFFTEQRRGRHRRWRVDVVNRIAHRRGSYRNDREFFRRADGTIFPVDFTVTPVVPGAAGVTLGSVLTFHDISRRRELEVELFKLACYDPLTGLMNRGQFYQNLSDAMARARRQQSRLALLFLDLDQFKSVNDTLGHDCGDALLIALADRLKKRFREVDKIGRFGGDEFLVLLEGVRSAEDAEKVAEELVALTEEPFDIAGNEMFVSVSIGSAIYEPDSPCDVTQLVKRADIAMYHAKLGSRRRGRRHSEPVQEASSQVAALRAALKRAIGRDELELQYQPRVSMQDSSIVGWEALVRWHHPELGLLSPSVFIPIAEDAGSIGVLGAWILRQACAQVGAWCHAGLWRPNMHMGVNLSGKQLEDKSFLSGLDGALKDFGVDPQAVEFELTETSLTRNASSVSVLEPLRLRGIGIAIDDFGIGYSSLGQLRRLPVSTLKIDQSFMEELTPACGAGVIVTAIIRMAQTLGLNVVAEGVEAAEQVDFLRAAGCAEAQGFHYSPPLSAVAATELLRAGTCLSRPH